MSGQLKVGMVREITVKTGNEHTAKYFYENLPNVFATLFLAGFMESVSAELINEHVEADEQSVGISMDLKHTVATPLGMAVRVKSEVTAVDSAKLCFKLESWDGLEKIGEAIHERFIIKPGKFNSCLTKNTVK